MTKTDALIDHLQQNGPASSSALAAAIGLPNTGRVSALLSTRRDRGQIEFENGRWMLNPDWDDILASELRDAQIILERAGYRVLPPARWTANRSGAESKCRRAAHARH